MRKFPSTRGEWMSLLLFPFKAFTVIAFIWLIVMLLFFRHSVHYVALGIATCVTVGCWVSTAVLLPSGLLQSLQGEYKAAVSSWVFGAVALIIGVMLLPSY